MRTTSSTTLAAHLRNALTRTARKLRQEGDAGLSPSLGSALATIDRHGPLTPSELATREQVQRPTVTRMLARLEAAGLIDRAADPTDRRSALVSSSEEGRALLTKIRTRKDAYLACQLRKLSPDDRATLDRAADILERMLEDRG